MQHAFCAPSRGVVGAQRSVPAREPLARLADARTAEASFNHAVVRAPVARAGVAIVTAFACGDVEGAITAQRLRAVRVAVLRLTAACVARLTRRDIHIPIATDLEPQAVAAAPIP